jgi:hypothetical protein
VLKKAGIIVTASVAGLLAVAPLAFAHEPADKSHGGETAEPAEPTEPTEPGTAITFTDGHGCGTGGANAMTGLVSLVPIAVNVPILNCNEVNFGNQAGNNS